MFRLSKVACQPKSIKTKRSQTAAGTRVGAIEEESQDANSRGARQEANEDQRKPLGFATCRGHAHLHSTALSLESGGLCQGSSLVLRAATQHLGSSEALTGQQHVGGACHHSQHQQVGAARHGSSQDDCEGANAGRQLPKLEPSIYRYAFRIPWKPSNLWEATTSPKI